MSLFGQNPFKEFRATLNEKAQKDEGNAFTKALNAAREKGENSFVVAGKKFDVKTEMAKLSKEDNTNDKEDDGEGMDKVQPKALKKKFKNRKDKDIDNDGDVDSSDEYLHNRRKTVSKKVDENDDEEENGNDDNGKKKMKKKGEKDDVEMNPKMESRIRQSLRDVLEANNNPNKDKAEKPEDALKGKGAKDMMEPAKKPEVDDTEEKGHDDASKAGKVTKPAKGRNGSDNVRTGDQKVQAPGTPMKKTMEAYLEVQEKWLKLQEPIDGATQIDPDAVIQSAEEETKE